MTINYTQPASWIRYDFSAIQEEFLQAKAAIMTLRNFPYQKGWVESMQEIELKREVAGTSRIEGAEFADGELEEAMEKDPKELLTRSQRQAHAAVRTYRWIATVPDDRPVDQSLVLEIHANMVTGADDDHCPPGTLRTTDHNVTFGMPRHRGASGGEECEHAFLRFTGALSREYSAHDPILQAMAAHYHLAAMHPFMDGNGRTARALEALLLQRAGLRNTCFIAMSNYYYDEKDSYLRSMSEARSRNHDITPFLQFTLRGLRIQIDRMLKELSVHVKKALYRNTMFDLFKRLESPKKRVIAERQLAILKHLLKNDKASFIDIYRAVKSHYKMLKHPLTAYRKDVLHLFTIDAIHVEIKDDTAEGIILEVNLDWPTMITESDFMERIKKLPKAKTTIFLP
ncbi:MAG: Fic family protein [Desulfovibrionaceae bacterium]